MENKGWILLYKKFQDWEWYDNPTVKIIFLHCLLEANFKQNKWQGKIIKRGQFPTSIEKLALANGLTTQQTKTALKKLLATDEINIQTTNRYSIITVKNYDLYQTNNKQIINKQQSQNFDLQQTTRGSNNNTINKEEDINKLISSSSSSENFEDFYKNLSEEEEEFLKNYSKGEKIRYFRPWLRKIYENGDFKEVLLKAIAKDKKEKQKAQRYALQADVPPEEKEDEAAVTAAMKKAREQVIKGLQTTNKGEKNG